MSDNHEQSAEGPILEHQKRVDEVNAIIVRAVGFDGLKLLQGREDLRVQLRRRLDAHKEANGDEATFRKGIADFLTPHVPYLAIQKITENLKLIIPAFSDDQAVAMEELENIFKKKTGQAIAGNDLPPDYYSFLDKIALQIKYAPASQFVLAKLGLGEEQIAKVTAAGQPILHEAKLKQYLGDSGFDFTQLRKQHGNDYAAKLAEIVEPLNNGTVDAFALMDFGFTSEQSMKIHDALAAKVIEDEGQPLAEAAQSSKRELPESPAPQAAAADQYVQNSGSGGADGLKDVGGEEKTSGAQVDKVERHGRIRDSRAVGMTGV